MGDAMKSLEKLVQGKLSKSLTKFLEKHIIQKEIEDELLIAEKKLGKAITEKLGIKCKTGEKVNELMRCIRFQMQSLVSALEDTEQYKAMQLGLAHSMSRYTLSFSSDKVDTMIIQAVSLLKDLTDAQLHEFIPEEIATEVREAAEISMGTEILKDDEMHIRTLPSRSSRSPTIG